MSGNMKTILTATDVPGRKSVVTRARAFIAALSSPVCCATSVFCAAISELKVLSMSDVTLPS